MADIATRVYNHTWKIDPIVRSVLDTDFYKLLMAQTIFRRHRAKRLADAGKLAFASQHGDADLLQISQRGGGVDIAQG